MIQISWTSPKTWVAAAVLTAAQLNQQLRDNLLATFPGIAAAKGDAAFATGANAIAVTSVGANGTMLVADSTQTNGWKVYVPQKCRLHRTSNQAIASGSDVPITFDNTMEDIDPLGMHDGVTNPERITIAVTGDYLVGGEATLQADTSGTQRYIRLYRNSTIIAEQRFSYITSTSVTPTENCSTLIHCTAGQYITVNVYQDTGVSRNVTNAVLWVALHSTN